MTNSSTVQIQRNKSENLMRAILTLVQEFRNLNNDINTQIETNKAAAVQCAASIEQLNADNEALAALHEENVQFIQRIEGIVIEELADSAVGE